MAYNLEKRNNMNNPSVIPIYQEAIPFPLTDEPEAFNKPKATRPRRSSRKRRVSQTPAPAKETITDSNPKKFKASTRSDKPPFHSSTSSSPSRRKPKPALSRTRKRPQPKAKSVEISATPMSPAKLLLLEARRTTALSKTSIMDVILDAKSPVNYEREEPLREAIYLHRQRMIPIPDARSYVFKDLLSLDTYWDQQRLFLRGVGSCGGEDWSGLMTLAHVSAERSTVAWPDDSITSESASGVGSSVLLGDVESVDIGA